MTTKSYAFDTHRTVFIPADQAGQTTSYTGTAGSLTFRPAPAAVAVVCTSFAYVSTTGTATTSSGVPVPANTLVVLPCPQGDAVTVSAIQVSAGGDIYAKPLA